MPAPSCSSSRRRDVSVKKRLGLLRRHKVVRFTGRVLTLAIALLAAAIVSSLTIDLGPWVRGLAESMYDAYTANSGGLNYQGLQCPPWAQLTHAVRSHWCAAAVKALAGARSQAERDRDLLSDKVVALSSELGEYKKLVDLGPTQQDHSDASAMVERLQSELKACRDDLARLQRDEGRTEEFAPAFAIAERAGLMLAPHGGELLGPDSVRTCLDELHADRLGHGVRTAEDPKLLDKPVSEVMGSPFPVVDADIPIDRLVTMLSKETPAALVRDGGHLVGIVNRYDVLRQVAGIG